ncbi:MAG: hypothetical protein AAFU71_04285 [Cyanobacteria bacterium J06632_22]
MQHNEIIRPVYAWSLAAMTLMTVFFQPQAFASTEDLTEQAMIEQLFLTDTPLPGATPEKHAELLTIRDGAVAWLGNYQGVRTEGDYLVIEFEHGEVPVTIVLEENGESGAIGAQCPITDVPLSQAPEDFQMALAECPDLVP